MHMYQTPTPPDIGKLQFVHFALLLGGTDKCSKCSTPRGPKKYTCKPTKTTSFICMTIQVQRVLKSYLRQAVVSDNWVIVKKSSPKNLSAEPLKCLDHRTQ